MKNRSTSDLEAQVQILKRSLIKLDPGMKEEVEFDIEILEMEIRTRGGRR